MAILFRRNDKSLGSGSASGKANKQVDPKIQKIKSKGLGVGLNIKADIMDSEHA